ncbi:MAG: hypothetical protein ACREDU_11670, partial [Methylocella sp.]
VQGTLFSRAADNTLKPSRRNARALDAAIDRLNDKYQRPVVTLASNMAPEIKDMGAKVAFTRIPELAEFHE